MIQVDTAGRMREHLPWSGLGHRVLVLAEDEAAARSLLALPQTMNSCCLLLQKYGRAFGSVSSISRAVAESSLFTSNWIIRTVIPDLCENASGEKRALQ